MQVGIRQHYPVRALALFLLAPVGDFLNVIKDAGWKNGHPGVLMVSAESPCVFRAQGLPSYSTVVVPPISSHHGRDYLWGRRQRH